MILRSEVRGSWEARSTNSPVANSIKYTRQASQLETRAVRPRIWPSISSCDGSEFTIRLTRSKTLSLSFKSPSTTTPGVADLTGVADLIGRRISPSEPPIEVRAAEAGVQTGDACVVLSVT